MQNGTHDSRSFSLSCYALTNKRSIFCCWEKFHATASGQGCNDSDSKLWGSATVHLWCTTAKAERHFWPFAICIWLSGKKLLVSHSLLIDHIILNVLLDFLYGLILNHACWHMLQLKLVLVLSNILSYFWCLWEATCAQIWHKWKLCQKHLYA